MKVTANGKTFTFPDGTSTEDIGTAIDEYFAGQAVQQQTVNQANNAPTREEPSLMQQAGDWLTGGQSAGQIAEQAGRGLVNIPFDVLQGGASLINAISQGLGGPKVLDDVYRPVDRPTDPWAQAGETIGGYLLPIGTAAKVAGAPAKLAGDIGSAGNMIAGSLADAANQEGDFAENAAINAGLNIATHGLINGVTRGVRGASNIISGNKTSAQRATTAPTETSPFSGDAAEATNPAVHAAEARAAQGVPMTPATRNPEEVVRTVAAQKRPNLASSLDELDINPQAEVLESAERLNVDSLLPSHFSGNEQYKAVEQAIKSRAGSALQVQENEAIRQLAQGAGEIIDRVSGAKDALGMSDKFIDTVNGRMSALMKRSEGTINQVEVVHSLSGSQSNDFHGSDVLVRSYRNNVRPLYAVMDSAFNRARARFPQNTSLQVRTFLDHTVAAAGTLTIEPRLDPSRYYIIMSAGTGAFTYSIELDKVSAVVGDIVYIKIAGSSSANPTVLVKNGIGGTTLSTFNNIGPIRLNCAYRFNESGNWVAYYITQSVETTYG